MLVGWMIVYLVSYVLRHINNRDAFVLTFLIGTRSTASCCPYIPSGAWTTLDGVIRVWSSAKGPARR